MDYSDKIKAIQQLVGIEASGIASSKTWIAIYHQLFGSVPYDLNIESMVKSIQQKIGMRVNGNVSPKTWNVLYDHVIEIDSNENTSFIDSHNEIILKSMTKEVVPFAKELIFLAAEQGIYIRLMGGVADDEIDHRPVKRKIINDQHGDTCSHDFGLDFDIGIYEQTQDGIYIYKENSPLYATVARLGESIGLTWAGDRKTFSTLPHFELRPAWAVRMKENEMVKELCRRRKENINLLAIL
jgi:hypothetical protein